MNSTTILYNYLYIVDSGKLYPLEMCGFIARRKKALSGPMTPLLRNPGCISSHVIGRGASQPKGCKSRIRKDL